MAHIPAARWGLLVFALGIVLLVVVFILAYGLFASTTGALVQADSLPPDSLPPLPAVLGVAAVKLGFLLVMGYISSLIAGKGIALLATLRETETE